MPRNARCVCLDVAHHVTQRGVDRTKVFYSQQDRQVYLDLMKTNIAETGVRILAWCLMTNHVHWIVVPTRAESLALLFQRVHGRYAQYLNARRGRSGHLWQNRYFSCAVEPAQEEVALRYVEWNPLRAGLTERPESYQWSSASAHLRGPGSETSPLLDWTYWRTRGGADGWRELLQQVEDTREAQRLRRATYAGSPLGSPTFVEALESRFGRHWQSAGRPPKNAADSERGTQGSATEAAR